MATPVENPFLNAQDTPPRTAFGNEKSSGMLEFSYFRRRSEVKIKILKEHDSYIIVFDAVYRATNGCRGTRSRSSRGRWNYAKYWKEDRSWASNGGGKMQFATKEDAEAFLAVNRVSMEERLNDR